MSDEKKLKEKDLDNVSGGMTFPDENKPPEESQEKNLDNVNGDNKLGVVLITTLSDSKVDNHNVDDGHYWHSEV